MRTTRALDYELESLDGGPLTIGSQVRHLASAAHSSGIIIDSANLAGRGAFTVLWAITPKFERFRIDSRGDISIGTVAPSTSLTVKGMG
jgi:hypothetical protein